MGFAKSFVIQQKNNIKLVLILPALVILGASLAFFADSQLLILPFLGILALTTFASLDYALYILVAFLPFSIRFIMASGTEMQVPTEPLLAMMMVAVILRWIIIKNRGEQSKFPLRLSMIIYAAGVCLSLINTTHLYASVKGGFRALAYMMLSVVVYNVINSKRRLRNLFIASIVPATVAVVWTAIFLADRLKMWRYTSAYEGLPFTSYAHYGSFVVAILMILMARAVYDKGSYDHVMWRGLLIIYVVAMCLCFSRGVWLAFIMSMGFLLLQRSEGIRSKKFLIIAGSIAFLVFILSIPQLSHLVISRASTIFSMSYGSNRERLLRWATAVSMFLKHPILGAGYGSFAFSFVNNPEILGAKSRFGMGAHSEYLQVLAETGIIGFIGWMGIIVTFFLHGFGLLRKIDKKKMIWRSLIIGIMSAEFALLIHFFVNNLVQSYIVGVPFWLLMGLLPAIGNIAEREKEVSDDQA